MVSYSTYLLAVAVAFLVASPAAAITGCSCFGQTYSSSLAIGSYPAFTNFHVLYSDSKAVGKSSTSKDNNGYCLIDDVLTPTTAANIADGIRRDVDTQYTNITGTRVWCYEAGNANNAEECVTYISDRKRNQMRDNPSQLRSCNYPTANFEPTDCFCSFVCTNNAVRCGNNCINPNTQSCVSGIPQNKARKRAIRQCDKGLTLCPVGVYGWECIDTATALDSCGGCWGQGGVDCSSEQSGALDISCVAGVCRSSRCDTGYDNINGTCILSN